MKNTSCKECQERHVGCHDKCQSYKEFLKDHEKRKKYISPSAGDLYIGEKRRARKIGKK